MGDRPPRSWRVDTVTVLAILAVGLVLGAAIAHTVGLGGVQQYSTLTETSTSMVAVPTSTSGNSMTFAFESVLPSNFTLGGYTFQLTCDGNCAEPPSGSGIQNLGYAVNFNVTNGADTQMMSFGWTPAGPSEPNPLPNPSSEVAFGGAVTMSWFTNSTQLSGLYLTVDVQA